MDQIHLDPQDKLPPHPPPPLGHIVNKTPSTHRTKSPVCSPPPQDNFWNSPKEETGVKVPIRNWLTPPVNNARFLRRKKSQHSHANTHMFDKRFLIQTPLNWLLSLHRRKRSAALNVIFCRFSKIPEVPLPAYAQQIPWRALIGWFCIYVRLLTVTLKRGRT